MDIIKWRASYETGICSMDVQHQKLIELINKMYKILRKEDSNESIDGVLDEMVKYGKMHLKEEENMLQTNGYPDFSNHFLLHQGYLNKLKILIEEWDKKDEAVAKVIYIFLRQWWMGHIVAEDQRYGEFLKAKGLK